MAIPMQIETLDEVQEQYRNLYVQGDDGAVYLDIEGNGNTPAGRAVRGERKLRESAEARAREAVHDAAQALADRDKKLDALRGSLLAMKVTEAAKAAGLMPSAIRDAQRAAGEVFRVDDDDQIVGRDASGKFADLAGWLAESREFAPHWHPASASGGGAPSNRIVSSGSSANTVSRGAFDAMSPTQRSALAQQGVTITD